MHDLDVQTALEHTASEAERRAHYKNVLQSIQHVLEGEHDWVAVLATVSSMLAAAFAYFHWTGFYRVDHSKPQELVIGPYQGSLGCLRIPFARGVCGTAARERRTQLVSDVHAFPGHIACASSTQSEIVVPVFKQGSEGEVVAVLDVDSDVPAAFTEVDQEQLELLCSWLTSRNPSKP